MFDGEGTIAKRGITQRGKLGYIPRVAITDKEIIDYLESTLNHGSRYEYRPRQSQTKSCYIWCVADINGIYWFLFHLAPLLRLNRKRLLAQEVLKKIKTIYNP